MAPFLPLLTSRSPRRAAVLLTLAALLAPASAWAQGSYRALPLGGRSALLGNTGVVRSRDTSAAFLNPATLSAVDNPQVAFSMNVFRFNFSVYDRWYQPGPIDTNQFPTLENVGLSRVGFSAVPSALCLYLVLGQDPFANSNTNAPGDSRQHAGQQDKRPRLAFCYANTDLSQLDVPAKNFQATSGNFVTEVAQGVSIKFTRYALGPTLAIPLGDGLSIGASFHGVVTDMDEVITSATMTYQNGAGVSTGLTYLKSGVSVDLAALMGLTWQASKKTTFGLSVYTPTVPIYGLFGGSEERRAGSAGVNTTSLALEQGTFRAIMPFRLQAGAAFDFGRWRMELDAFMALAEGNALRAEGDGSSVDQSRRETTRNGGAVSVTQSKFLHQQSAGFNFNAAAGAEYFVTPSFSLLGGMYTDFSPIELRQDRPELSDLLVASRSRFSLTFGIGSYGELGDVLFGTELSYLWGKVAAPNHFVVPPNLDWSSLYGYQMLFVLSGSTNIRVLKRAYDQVETLVTGKDQDKTAPAAPPK